MNDWAPFEGVDFHKGSAKKTPYQLDLEVIDRKPDIVPKVGDKVKIKSREWYEKWKNKQGDIDGVGMHRFVPEMSKYCGKVFNVNRVAQSWFTLEDARFGWNMFMFEEVYPQELSTEDGLTKASDAIGAFISGLGKGSSVASTIPALNSVQGIGIATDWSKLVSDTAARITLPQQSLFCNAGFNRQSVLKDKEPELQTIKKHRFIKLEKL